MVRLGPARIFASKDVHEPGARTDAELLEHVRTVMLDGPDGEVEDLADLLVRMAEREEICHLVLSSCETPPLMCSYLGVTMAAPRDARGGDPTLDRRADAGDAVDTQRPPSISARSRIETRPMCSREGRAAATSKPLPSSSTRMRTPPSRSSTSTVTLEAELWRPALLSASCAMR
jgi:hypothetical protein